MTDDIQIDDKAITEEIKEKVTAEITPKIKEELTQQITADVTEKVTADVTTRASEAARKDLMEKIAGKAVDENAAPWVKEGRQPKDYTEVSDYGKQQALREFEAKQKVKEEELAQKTKAEQLSETEKQKKWNVYWEGQLKEMTTDGRLPKVDDKISEKLVKGETLTEAEKQDQGLRARAELFAKAKEVKESNLEVVYYKHLNQKPAGAMAPVFGIHRGTTPSSKTDWTYEELHNTKNMQDLMK